MDNVATTKDRPPIPLPIYLRKVAAKTARMFGVNVAEFDLDDLGQCIALKALSDLGCVNADNIIKIARHALFDWAADRDMVPIPQHAKQYARRGRGTDASIAYLERQYRVDPGGASSF